MKCIQTVETGREGILKQNPLFNSLYVSTPFTAVSRPVSRPVSTGLYEFYGHGEAAFLIDSAPSFPEPLSEEDGKRPTNEEEFEVAKERMGLSPGR